MERFFVGLKLKQLMTQIPRNSYWKPLRCRLINGAKTNIFTLLSIMKSNPSYTSIGGREDVCSIISFYLL